MSFTLIDFFNGFQTLKRSKRFSAGAQSTYYAILAEFNLAHYPATLPISTRDLQQLAGLKSVSTTHECRNVLKNNKLIDFKTQRDTTIYRLLTEHLPNAKKVSAEHQPNGNRTPDGLFAIPCAGEAAQSSPQTPFKETETETSPLPPQGATGGGGSKDTQASERETVKVARKLTDAERESFEEFAEETASLQDAKPLGKPDVFAIWNENRLPWLGADQKYRLAQYEEEYGFETVSAAIIRTKDKHTYPTFAKFKEELDKAVVARQQQETVQTQQGEYQLPEAEVVYHKPKSRWD